METVTISKAEYDAMNEVIKLAFDNAWTGQSLIVRLWRTQKAMCGSDKYRAKEAADASTN